MAELYVEEWAPEYGSSVQTDESLAPSQGDIDSTVEHDGDWDPMPGRDDGIPAIAFVDGIRRVDARLTLEDGGGGPVPGICATFAIGAAVWRRHDPSTRIPSTGIEEAPIPSTRIEEARVQRLAVFLEGRSAVVPASGPGLTYKSESVGGTDPGLLISHLHTQMRRAEAELSLELARRGYFVVADGPISELAAEAVIGYIKSHRVSYLPDPLRPVLGRLRAGERTPLFGMPSYARYSWYLRLAPRTSHSWSGIVRCEAPGTLSLAEVQVLADRSAALLPGFASEAHIDARAPQNLVPIAALERELRRRLGDRELVYRMLRESVGRGVSA